MPNGYVPNFTMTGGNLPVPYQAGGIPQVLGGTMAPAPEALAAEQAAKASLLSRLAPFFSAGTLPLAALALDPGSLDQHKSPIAAALFNPNQGDTGFTGTVKGIGRGVFGTRDKLQDTINEGYSDVGDFFTKTKAERELQNEVKAEKDQGPGVPGAAAALNPTMDSALGLEGKKRGGYGGMIDLQGQSAPGGSTLDALLQNVINHKPGEAPDANPADALRYGELGAGQAVLQDPQIMRSLDPRAKLALALGTGMGLGKEQYSQGIAKGKGAASKAQMDWAKDAADIGIKSEGEKRQERDDGRVKIHATRNGILVEQTQVGEDGSTHTVIQPLDNSIFGGEASGALDPKGKVSVMGKTFTNLDKDPLGKEKMLLSQLESSGELIPIMNDMKDAMAKADKEAMTAAGGATSSGAGLDKMKWDARRAVILKGLVDSPKFRQQMIDRLANIRAKTGTAASPSYSSGWDSLENSGLPYEDPVAALAGE